MKNICFAVCCFLAISVHAQTLETTQKKPVVIINGTIHTGTGTVIENGIIGFENGKISFVGDARTVRYNENNFEKIDATGKHIYPGLIAPNSILGLNELEMVRSTNDMDEVGKYNPNVRSIIAYNTDSRVIPTLRTNGILYAQIIPHGGVISGTSSVVELDGWNWEDAAYKTDNALHIHWPNYNTVKWKNGWQVSLNEKYMLEVSELEAFFNEAKAYSIQTNPTSVNLRFEAMRKVFSGEKKIFMHANAAKEIMHAIYFAETYGLTPVIVGGAESYLLTGLLVEKNVPVLLERIHSLPYRSDYDIDLSYKIPGLLKRAGVLVGISSSENGNEYWNQRNLPFEAGTAAAYGLTKEEALSCITLNNAKILGIDYTTGSLETGKDATCIISSGDLLNMSGNTIEKAFIRGRVVETENWQHDLYNKFTNKYKPE